MWFLDAQLFLVVHETASGVKCRDVLLVSVWVSGAARWLWSPLGCPLFPTICVRRLQINHSVPVTAGGSGSATTHTSSSKTGQQFQVQMPFQQLDCVFMFECSPTEQKALPAYSPVTARLRKRQRAIAGRTLAPRPSLCPGPLSHQVATLPYFYLSYLFFYIPAVISQLTCKRFNN